MSPARQDHEPDLYVLASARGMQAVDRRALALGADGFALMRRADEATRRAVEVALDSDRHCVLDADVLSCQREAPERFLARLRGRGDVADARR